MVCEVFPFEDKNILKLLEIGMKIFGVVGVFKFSIFIDVKFENFLFDFLQKFLMKNDYKFEVMFMSIPRQSLKVMLNFLFFVSICFCQTPT